jgi:hypothetical protein
LDVLFHEYLAERYLAATIFTRDKRCGVGLARVLISSALLVLAAGGARAAPVSACAEQPFAGEVLHGPVLEIPDASSLCIARGTSPAAWVAVQLPNLGVTRSALMAAAFGKNATCVVGPDLKASCIVEGRRLIDQLHRPAILRAASAWR